MRGCYGLGLVGLDTTSSPALHEVGPGSPVLAVDVRVVAAGIQRPEFRLGADAATVWLSDGEGWAEITRDPLSVLVHTTREYDVETLLHPTLSGTFAVVNRWLGRDAFHAAAVVIGGCGWIVTGDKGRGKSTLTADLSLHGHPVMTDDLSVVAGGRVFAGPAFVDLRPDAARALGVGRDLGVVGARARTRYDVTAPRTEPVDVAGWVTLDWSDDDEIALEPVPLVARMPILLQNQAVLLEPPDPRTFLQHIALPMLRFRRPARWELREQIVAELVSGLG